MTTHDNMFPILHCTTAIAVTRTSSTDSYTGRHQASTYCVEVECTNTGVPIASVNTIHPSKSHKSSGPHTTHEANSMARSKQSHCDHGAFSIFSCKFAAFQIYPIETAFHLPHLRNPPHTTTSLTEQQLIAFIASISSSPRI